VGLLGGGVIGGGWAARFLLNGSDVALYDPDPEAPRKVAEVLANAKRATAALLDAPLPPEGRLTFVGSPEEAADGVDFVQESAPERTDIKQELLARADAVAGEATIFASSTSGLLPSVLQERMRSPERLVVGHPFNPVYLLPLVEVCAGERRREGVVARAAAVYEAVGMRPLVLDREIDGFVADRLLEALWREALWLVHDGVATVSQVDDAIRFGAGLRWSAMGTFLVYRMAGGEAGMRHFMAQFGPALQWPWTKLTDVPELTDDLVDRIVAQSDEQADGRSIRELEAVRDECLVAVLRGLQSVPFGAGAVVAEFDRELRSRARPLSPAVPAGGVAVELGARRIDVAWSDDHRSELLPLWLRDNCRCVACVHPHTGERLLDTFGVDQGIAPVAATADERQLLVDWSDGHRSEHDLAWLRAHCPCGRHGDDLPPKQPWRGDELAAHLPEVDHADVVAGADGLRRLVELVWTKGVAFVRDVPTNEDALRHLARRVGHIRETNFGPDFHVVSMAEPNNVAYTPVELRPHTDLVNHQSPPGVQFLHCFRADAPGGESTLVDGFWVADRVRAVDAAAFRTLTTVAVPYRFHDDDHDIRWQAPVIGLGPDGTYRDVRFHNALTEPLTGTVEQVEELYAALRRFDHEARRDEAQLIVRLRPGDVMVFDNRRVLHGRRAFDPTNGGRHLFGLYVDLDDWRSRLRVLRRTPPG
jgi:carnitine 3-dehydrogenase